MALPLLLLIPAAIAAVSGIGVGIHGGVKMNRANKKMKEAQERDNANLSRLETTNKETCYYMDKLGRHEMEILASFSEFSELFSRLHNRPEFKDITLGNVRIPPFNRKAIEKASVGASVLLGGLGGAALGTAGAFAASSATSAAVMALGTASTGTAIASLSGVAATNATLAALGGGSLAAGGGGMALGSMVLGGASLGVGLLIGGVIFSVSGYRLEGKADKALHTMQENERRINQICDYLNELIPVAKKYDSVLMKVNAIYRDKLSAFKWFMSNFKEHDVDWNQISVKEQSLIGVLVMLVGLLYEMCKVKLVKQSGNNIDTNTVNHKDINKSILSAEEALNNLKKRA